MPNRTLHRLRNIALEFLRPNVSNDHAATIQSRGPKHAVHLPRNFLVGCIAAMNLGAAKSAADRRPAFLAMKNPRHFAQLSARPRRAQASRESCVEESVVLLPFSLHFQKDPAASNLRALFLPPCRTRATSHKAGKRSNRCARRVRSCRLGRLGASDLSIRPLCGMNRTFTSAAPMSQNDPFRTWARCRADGHNPPIRPHRGCGLQPQSHPCSILKPALLFIGMVHHG